jgi:pimeloyl-ACP methyl ester carboxylesterase
MATAKVNGLDLWYRWTGEGEPVVHIHGGGLGHGNFARLTPLIAERYAVLDLDLRGYGQSARPRQDYSFGVWSDDVAALMDAVGLDRAHVHGTSTGGMVALQLAVDYPDRLRSLVLSCTAGKVDYAGWLTFEVWIRIMQHAGLEDGTLAMLLALEGFSRDFLDGPEGPAIVETIRKTSSAACSTDVFIAACRAFQGADFGPHLARIAVPTLVMTGEDDLMTPVDVGPSGIGSRKLAELIPGAELVLLDGAGHTHLYQMPEETARPILAFLEQVNARR